MKGKAERIKRLCKIIEKEINVLKQKQSIKILEEKKYIAKVEELDKEVEIEKRSCKAENADHFLSYYSFQVGVRKSHMTQIHDIRSEIEKIRTEIKEKMIDKKKYEKLEEIEENRIKEIAMKKEISELDELSSRSKYTKDATKN